MTRLARQSDLAEHPRAERGVRSILKWIGAIVLAIAFLGGCGGGSQSMVGSWEFKLTETAQKAMPAGQTPPALIMNFAEDGTWTGSAAGFDGKTSDAKGTWKLDGKNLTIITDDGSSGPKSETVVLSDDMRSFAPAGMGAIGTFVKK